MDILAIRLKKARIQAGLKQVDVSRKTGINNKTLSGYENEVSEPDAETLRKLAELYDVSVDWLLAKEGTTFHFESEFDRFIRYMEEKYSVDLSDDPVLTGSILALIETVALTKQQQNYMLQA